MRTFLSALLMNLFMVCIMIVPVHAYNIHVLQVADIAPFHQGYTGFIDELAKNGLVEGQNLTITKHIIDAEADAGLWKKAMILLEIRKTTKKIIAAKPDLVLTIGTPATKYSREKIVEAGIPLVFTIVTIPEAVGCKSMSESGPGFTGSTIYTDPSSIFEIARFTFPNAQNIGVIHSDDDNAEAFVKEANEKAPQHGFTLFIKEVSKSHDLTPEAKELSDKVDIFMVPPDSYYGLRNFEPSRKLTAVALEKKTPTFACMTSGSKGGLIYIGADFTYIGALAAGQVVKILKEGADPGSLPVLRQEDLKVCTDLEMFKKYGVEVPTVLLQIMQPFVESK